jgi:hypothetical protein
MADFSYIQNCGLTNPTAEPEIEVWLPDWTKNQCYSKVSANDRKHEVLSTHQSHVNATSFFPFPQNFALLESWEKTWSKESVKTCCNSCELSISETIFCYYKVANCARALS